MLQQGIANNLEYMNSILDMSNSIVKEAEKCIKSILRLGSLDFNKETSYYKDYYITDYRGGNLYLTKIYLNDKKEIAIVGCYHDFNRFNELYWTEEITLLKHQFSKLVYIELLNILKEINEENDFIRIINKNHTTTY